MILVGAGGYTQYWVGSISSDDMNFVAEYSARLDFGKASISSIYAAKTGSLTSALPPFERRVLFGFSGCGSGFSGCAQWYVLPRDLSISSTGKLLQYPAREMVGLRKNAVLYPSIAAGSQVEMLVQCAIPKLLPQSGVVGVKTLLAHNNNQSVQVGYNFTNQSVDGFAAVSPGLSVHGAHTDKAPLSLLNRTSFELRVFVDGHMVESFFSGDAVITTITGNVVSSKKVTSSFVNTAALHCNMRSWTLGLKTDDTLAGTVAVTASGVGSKGARPSAAAINEAILKTSEASDSASGTTFAVIGLVNGTTELKASMGMARKHPANPLLGPGSAYTSDNGYLSVIFDPSDPLGRYRLWYDASPTQRNCIAHANSSDGIVWTEPHVGNISIDGSIANNCVVVANGLGVYRDPTEEPGSAALFKAFGGIGKYGGRLANHGGTMISADGINWFSPRIYDWPDPPQRYDTSNNVMYDRATRRYIATTRRHPTTSKSDGDRAIGIGLSSVDRFAFNASGELPLILKGTHDHQIYAQETFKWHQLYMGIAMVYDATDSVNGRVHCRLVWSKAILTGWEFVEEGGLTGRDFIPLGHSGPAGTEANAFDSHLCFATRPVHTADGERVYYSGSNGKHSGSKPHRNASLGLATFRPDGFAGMAGSGTLQTIAVIVTAAHLTITVDILSSRGSVRLGVRRHGGLGSFVPGLSPANCTSITANVTAKTVFFASAKTLASLVGQDVSIVLEATDAIVYTLGFSPTVEVATLRDQ
eukprot:COSAG05_NODE_1016_length_6185_cov_4.604831_5_plen_757_part_00